jgi:hypothetical protein
MKPIPLLLILYIWGASLLAQTMEPEELGSFELHSSLSPTTAPILFVHNLVDADPYQLIDRRLVVKLSQVKLSSRRLRLEPYPRDFFNDLKAHKIASRWVLSPKLFLMVALKKENGPSDYAFKCRLVYLEYEPVAGSKDTYLSKIRWTKEQAFSGIAAHEVEAFLVRYLQKELETLAKFLKSREKKPTVEPVSVPSTSSSEVPYSLEWKDPDSRRGRFYAGASAGTPTWLANLNVGYWGSKAFPFLVEFSGMYYSVSQRGIEMDLAWIWDNEGDLKQAVGLSVVGFNESSVATQQNQLGFQTGTVTIDQMAFYGGPSYLMEWKNLQLRVGAPFRMDGAAQSTVRFLGQVGYTFPLPF